MMEKKSRSIIKSLLWRLIGVIVLAFITYIVTQSLITTSLITFLHHFSFIFIYYFHERAWLKVSWSDKRKRIIKPFTYEIILGHGVLGLITWLCTGSWTNVTFITILYIENKLWMYVVYDWLWSKTKWLMN